MKEFGRFIPNDCYVTGLWRSTLPLSLLWEVRVRNGVEPVLNHVSAAPSWSWACVEGPIEKPSEVRNGKCQGIFTVTDVLVDVELEDPTGKIRKAELGIYGFLIQTNIRDHLSEDTAFPPTSNHKAELSIHDRRYIIGSVGHSFYYSLDTGVEPELIDGYFLFIGIREPDNDTKGSIGGLLLQPTGEPDTFQRIGTLSVSGAATVALRYKLKQGIENRDEAWELLKEALRVSGEELGEDETSTTGSMYDDRPRTQPADTAALYAKDHEYDENCFERLVPRAIKLV